MSWFTSREAAPSTAAPRQLLCANCCTVLSADRSCSVCESPAEQHVSVVTVLVGPVDRAVRLELGADAMRIISPQSETARILRSQFAGVTMSRTGPRNVDLTIALHADGGTIDLNNVDYGPGIQTAQRLTNWMHDPHVADAVPAVPSATPIWLAALPEARDDSPCPYCGITLTRPPRIARKCEHCGERFFVRTAPDGIRRVLTREAAERVRAWQRRIAADRYSESI